MKDSSELRAIAIIPARGGSKGLPQKNVLPLCGKPLISHSIEDVQESALCHDVYVSTDDADITRISEESGAKVIQRPAELASDIASSESALVHAIEYLKQNEALPDLVIFLQCTSPVRTGADIDNAILKMQEEGADSILSVSPSHRFLWESVNGEAKSINYDYRHRKRRQDMNPQYVENGSIYVFKPWVLSEFGNRLGGKVSLYTMSEEAAHEIDSPLDFKIAEFLLNKQVTSNAN